MTRLFVLSMLAGCTGFSLGENTPGGDTWTDPPPPTEGEHHVGAIGVERDEAQAWVVHEEMQGGLTRSTLSAIDTASGAATEVLDVTGTTDRRVMFPSAGRMLLMAQRDDSEDLVLFDTTTRTRIASTITPTWYWGTRTAPSGKAIVVADNEAANAPLHVIDPTTLRHQVLPHGGDAIEAMWDHDSDVLIALSVTAPFGETPSAKLLRYDLTGADLDQPIPPPTVAWQLDGYGWDEFFSFTWIGISPDDHWAVLPLIKHTAGGADGEHVLLVLDQTTGAVTLEPGSGPVGFTSDGAQIVSYGIREGTPFHEDPWLIDPVTHVRTTVEMPFDSAISYFISGNYLAVAGAQDVVYNLATDIQQTLPTTGLALNDFVRRGDNELWLETSGQVFDLDLPAATLTNIAMPALVGNINVAHDLALTTDLEQASVYRTEMASRQQLAKTTLPSPFTTPPPDSLGYPSATHRTLRRGRLQSRRAHDGDAIALDR